MQFSPFEKHLPIDFYNLGSYNYLGGGRGVSGVTWVANKYLLLDYSYQVACGSEGIKRVVIGSLIIHAALLPD